MLLKEGEGVVVKYKNQRNYKRLDYQNFMIEQK